MTGVGSNLAGATRRRLHLEYYDPARNSDKEYYLVLQAMGDDKYEVHAFWGRRGSSLQSQQKTKGPASIYAAQTIFDKFFNDKAREGYKVVADEQFSSVPNVQPDISVSVNNSPAVEDEGAKQWTIRDFTRNPVQPFVNAELAQKAVSQSDTCIMTIPVGKRILVYAGKSGLEAFGHRGEAMTLPETMAEDLIDLEGPMALDGIWTGSEYVVFDAPKPDTEYRDRYEQLFELLNGTVGERVRILDLAFSEAEKMALFEDARKRNEPGIWLRNGKRDNHPGQCDANWLQLDFAPRAMLVVMSLNGKCSLGVDDGLGLIKVAELAGAVVHSGKPPFDQDNPSAYSIMGAEGRFEVSVGDVVEVEYDSWGGHGKLMQSPRILSKREDAAPEQCAIDQLALH